MGCFGVQFEALVVTYKILYDLGPGTWVIAFSKSLYPSNKVKQKGHAADPVSQKMPAAKSQEASFFLQWPLL